MVRGSEFADQEVPMASVLTLLRGDMMRKWEKYQLMNIKRCHQFQANLIKRKEKKNQSFWLYQNNKNLLEQVPTYFSQKTIQTEVSLECQ